MLGTWFRPLELLISFEEFQRLPRHPAYKYEYFGGRAVLSPRPSYERAVLDVATFRPHAGALEPAVEVALRQLEDGDWAALPELLAAAFHHMPPFATLADDQRVRAARDCMGYTRTGGDGSIIAPACFVAASPARETRLAGAIVITSVPARQIGIGGDDRPHLTWVMVHPWCARRGCGTRLLISAVHALRDLGHRELATTSLAGNGRSTLWHWRNGFRLLDNPFGVRPVPAVVDFGAAEGRHPSLS